MKRTTMVLCTCLALVACAKQDEPTQASQTGAEPEAVSAAPAAPQVIPYKRKQGRLAGTLPGGIKLDFPYFVRTDASVREPDGSTYRKVVLVLRGFEQEEAVRMINQAMKDAEFNALGAEGDLKQTFAKEQFGEVRIAVAPFNESKNNVESVSYRVEINFPAVKPADKSTGT